MYRNLKFKQGLRNICELIPALAPFVTRAVGESDVNPLKLLVPVETVNDNVCVVGRSWVRFNHIESIAIYYALSQYGDRGRMLSPELQALKDWLFEVTTKPLSASHAVVADNIYWSLLGPQPILNIPNFDTDEVVKWHTGVGDTLVGVLDSFDCIATMGTRSALHVHKLSSFSKDGFPTLRNLEPILATALVKHFPEHLHINYFTIQDNN